MKKINFLTALFVNVCIIVNAQHFEWAVSSYNVNGTYKFSKIDKKGNLIVAGNLEGFAGRIYDGKSNFFIYGTNDSVLVGDIHKEPVIIVNYSFDGKINWLKTIVNASIYGLEVDKNNNVVVLGESDGNCIFRGLRDEKNKYGEDVWISEDKTFFLYKIDEQGNSISMFKDELNYIEEATSFHILNSGKYLITGELNNVDNDNDDDEDDDGKKKKKLKKRVFKNLSNDFGGSNYSNCMMFFDNQFKIDDARAIGYLCLNNNQKAIITQNESGFFYCENDTKTKQTYIAFANTKGKLEWVKSLNAELEISTLTTTSNEIILAGRFKKLNSIQEKIADTSNNKNCFIAVFNKNAELKWINPLQVQSIKSLATDNAKNIYFIDEEFLSNKVIINDDTTLNPFGDLYISSFDINGNYRWTKASGLPSVNGNLDHPQLVVDYCGNLYVSGSMLMQDLGIQYAAWDEALLKGSGHGSMPIVAKIKNTLPSALINKNEPVKQSCTISPGVWKINIYPNPFTTKGFVKYSLTYDDKAIITLYDLSGKIIKVLLPTTDTKKGEYTINMTNMNIPKGSYIIALKGTEAMAFCRVIIVE